MRKAPAVPRLLVDVALAACCYLFCWLAGLTIDAMSDQTRGEVRKQCDATFRETFDEMHA